MVVVSALILSSATAIVMAAKAALGLRRYKYEPVEQASSASLPSVSVCIAARNETHALAHRLDNVLASEYKKLEVLVLDDNSEDDTSLIIKSYAHAGVRFIPGKDLPKGWLGKNHAYQTLAEQASGEFIIFLDVDTILGRNTIRDLASYMTNRSISMVSVLPSRLDGYRNSAVFGSLRYYWELICSSSRKPPAASALWMIHRKTLLELEKGIPGYRSSIRPEMHIARQFVRGLQYAYLVGGPKLGVGYEKLLRSQYETAARVYWPVSGRSMPGALVAIACLVLLALPFPVLLFSNSMGTLAAFSLLLGALSIFQFSAVTYGGTAALRRVIFWPVIVIQELVLYVYSIVRYASGTVSWKGRIVSSGPSNRSHLELDE